MLCYQDRTFCPFHEECEDGASCDKAFTDKVRQGAVKWWGGEGAPIAVHAEKPRCFKEKTP